MASIVDAAAACAGLGPSLDPAALAGDGRVAPAGLDHLVGVAAGAAAVGAAGAAAARWDAAVAGAAWGLRRRGRCRTGGGFGGGSGRRSSRAAVTGRRALVDKVRYGAQHVSAVDGDGDAGVLGIRVAAASRGNCEGDRCRSGGHGWATVAGRRALVEKMRYGAQHVSVIDGDGDAGVLRIRVVVAHGTRTRSTGWGQGRQRSGRGAGGRARGVQGGRARGGR